MLNKLKAWIFFIVILLVVGSSQVTLAQKSSNRPGFHHTISERLGESDGTWSRSKTGKHGFFKQWKIDMSRPKGFNHPKNVQTFQSHHKKGRSGFYKKKYTGKKKSFFGIKAPSWGGGGGGHSFKTHGREDKRLFKAPAKRGRKHRKAK